ncbi:5266_t:CDS:1, partial [Acaulospora colombiana]
MYVNQHLPCNLVRLAALYSISGIYTFIVLSIVLKSQPFIHPTGGWVIISDPRIATPELDGKSRGSEAVN